MKPLHLAASIAMVTLISSHAVAGPKWLPFSKGDNFTEYLLRAPVHAKGHFVKVWMLFDYADDQTDQSIYAYGKTYRSSIELDEYNCAAGEEATLQVSMYTGQMGTGDQVSSQTVPDPAHLSYTYTIPGSIGDQNMRAACSAAGIRTGN
jgi:hypothetical protein